MLKSTFKSILNSRTNYIGQMDSSGNKQGFGVMEDRGELFIGMFSNDSFQKYGMVSRSSSDKLGHQAGYFSGDGLDGIGIRLDGISIQFGYFCNNVFETGFTILDNEVTYQNIKYKDYLLSFTKSLDATKVNLLCYDGVSFIKDNKEDDFPFYLKTSVQEDFGLGNYFKPYKLGCIEEKDSIYDGQIVNDSCAGYGLVTYPNSSNWSLVYKKYSSRELISKKENVITFDGSGCTLVLYEDTRSKGELHIGDMIYCINGATFTIKKTGAKEDTSLSVYANLDVIFKFYSSGFVTDVKQSSFAPDNCSMATYDDQAEERLNNLIGLSNVKRRLERIQAFARKNRDKRVNLHMAFLGNPGTGKTTVAKCLADIFCKYGILPTSKFINANRRLLVGEHVGETAVKTQNIVSSSMGGVLLVDEAYSLAVPSEKDFGSEAIAILLKEMEDKKGDFCCILAGYTNEMNRLFNSNPGFKSRIQYIINFEDYTEAELKLILISHMEKNYVRASDEVVDKMASILLYEKNHTNNYGNARSARNLVEQLSMISTDRNDFDGEITLQDISIYLEENSLVEKRIKRTDKISYSSLLDVYKDSYKESNPFKNDNNLYESMVTITNYYGDTSEDKTGFIISPDGYAITVGLHTKECLFSNAKRHILDRKNNRIHVEDQVVLSNSIGDISLVKLTEMKGYYTHLPVLEELKAKDYSNQEVIITGTKTTSASKEEYYKELATLGSISNGVYEIDLKNSFLDGALITPKNSDTPIGILYQNSVYSLEKILEVFN